MMTSKLKACAIAFFGFGLLCGQTRIQVVPNGEIIGKYGSHFRNFPYFILYPTDSLTDGALPQLLLLDDQTGKTEVLLENHESLVARSPLSGLGTEILDSRGPLVVMSASPDRKITWWLFNKNTGSINKVLAYDRDKTSEVLIKTLEGPEYKTTLIGFGSPKIGYDNHIYAYLWVKDANNRESIFNCVAKPAQGGYVFEQLPVRSPVTYGEEIQPKPEGGYRFWYNKAYLTEANANSQKATVLYDAKNPFLGISPDSWHVASKDLVDPVVTAWQRGGTSRLGYWNNGSWQELFSSNRFESNYSFGGWKPTLLGFFAGSRKLSLVGFTDETSLPDPNMIASGKEKAIVMFGDNFGNPELVVKEGDVLPDGKIFDIRHKKYVWPDGCTAGIFTYANSSSQISGWYRFEVTTPACLAQLKKPVIESVSNPADFKTLPADNGLVSILGYWLTNYSDGGIVDDIIGTAKTKPWPYSLSGVKVFFNGIPGRLMYAVTRPNDSQGKGKSHIIAQVPSGMNASNPVNIRVELSDPQGVLKGSAEYQVTISRTAPALFRDYARLPEWPVIVQNLNRNYELVGGNNPPARGETLMMWGTGFGSSLPKVPEGNGAEVTGSLVWVTDPVRIVAILDDGTPWEMELPDGWMNGALVSPQYPGVYQVAFRIPEGMPATTKMRILVRTGAVNPVYTEEFTIGIK